MTESVPGSAAGRHGFEADDSGISCKHCGLPEAHSSHYTAVKVRKLLETRLAELTTLLDPLLARRAEVRRDALIWEALDYAEQEGDITTLPVFGWISFNVTTQYDHGETFSTASLDGIWTQDGTMIADSDSDRLYVWEIVIEDLRLEPNDAKTYYFKWWPNVERTNATRILSWDWTPVEPIHLHGRMHLDGMACEERVGERREAAGLTTVVGNGGTLADQSAASQGDSGSQS